MWGVIVIVILCLGYTLQRTMRPSIINDPSNQFSSNSKKKKKKKKKRVKNTETEKTEKTDDVEIQIDAFSKLSSVDPSVNDLGPSNPSDNRADQTKRKPKLKISPTIKKISKKVEYQSIELESSNPGLESKVETEIENITEIKVQKVGKDDGFVKVKSKTLRIIPSVSVRPQPFRVSKPGVELVTKKQRENQKKREREKEVKQGQVDLQKHRLAQYRREQELEYIKGK